jgi:hypothetical protein
MFACPSRPEPMYTDFYLKRGKDHAICEDFAATGIIGEHGFALVSDGCSSSKEVDFGSRILVHSAKDNLMTLLASGAPFDATAFAAATIAKTAEVVGCFRSLPVSTLDATLLLALVRSDSTTESFCAQVCFWGDGVAIVRKKERVVATMLRFPGNAPCYLTYSLDESRRQAYLEHQGGRRQILRVTLDLEGKEISREESEECFVDPIVPHQEQFSLEAQDSLALVSDGITQFFTAENTPVSWEKLAPKFVDFKKPTGVFVRRRMNFFERENRAAGLRHLDDLSVAAITLLR